MLACIPARALFGWLYALPGLEKHPVKDRHRYVFRGRWQEVGNLALKFSCQLGVSLQ